MKPMVGIWTDGSCLGNPGPGGWAYLLRHDGIKDKARSGGLDHTTNNVMEITAATMALRKLKVPCKVLLITDSQYVIQGITSWIHGWEKRGWKTKALEPVANKKEWLRLKEAKDRHDVTWQWVRGHSGVPENELVDRMAREEAERRR